MVLSECR